MMANCIGKQSDRENALLVSALRELNTLGESVCERDHTNAPDIRNFSVESSLFL